MFVTWLGLAPSPNIESNSACFSVKEFVEKPDESSAKTYLEQGNYLWNSGIFIVRPSVLIKEAALHSAELLHQCRLTIQSITKDLDFIRLSEQEFAKKVYKIRDNIRKNILKIKSENNKIIGYGSPAKATTALNFFGISDEIGCIVEDNNLKHGKYLPGMKIPIVSKDKIKTKPDCALVLAWNFFEEIKKRNSDLAHKFVSIKDLEN